MRRQRTGRKRAFNFSIDREGCVLRVLVDRASFELALSDEISETRVLIPTCSITLPAQLSAWWHDRAGTLTTYQNYFLVTLMPSIQRYPS